jgi:4-hydroxythreonine-4-phosphate dehydrogenase
MTRPILLAITSGDRDGIGLEVARKALNQAGPQRSTRFVLACSNDSHATKELKKLTAFKQIQISSNEASLDVAARVMRGLRASEILVWRDAGNEAAWVQSCAWLALHGEINGIVTGPVSKGRFRKISAKLMGHTGMLSQMAKVPVQQGYIGSKLNIVLATDHIPLARVESRITNKSISRSIQHALLIRRTLRKALQSKPIAVLGLNPHAGEDGIIGSFEKSLRLPPEVLGPIPADAAFTPGSLSKYSVVVALYHDQGLIPFKMLHGQDSGFQVSLGLPFVRTSVDHGTARDIFGLNKANHGSMVDAIQGAIKLVLMQRRQ